MRNFLVGVFCLFTYCLNAQLETGSVTTVTGDTTIYFYQFKPPYFNNTDLFPLIISLHGGGESSGNTRTISTLPLLLTTGIPKLLANNATMEFTWNGKTEGFVVLAPQSLGYEVASWPPYYVNAMITYAIQNLRVDPKRIFLTGYSWGGDGAWNYAVSADTNAAKLAGVVPASATDPAAVYHYNGFCNIAQQKLAAWVFNGKDDFDNSNRNSVNNVNACNGLNIPAVDSIYPDGGHDIYNPRVYDTTNNTHYPNMYQWMLKISRDLDPDNNLPPVAIIKNGTQNVSVINLTAPVKMKDLPLLDGAASYDPDDIIMDYLWMQDGGPLTLLPVDITTEQKRQFPVYKIIPPNGSPIGLPAGTYNFRLRVKDYLTSKVNNAGNHTVFAPLDIVVSLPASGHAGPVTDAGDDHTLSSTDTYWPASGSANPMYGGNLNSYNWKFLDGPQTASLAYFNGSSYQGGDNNVLFTNMDAPGVYTFEFSAGTDLGDIGRDTIAITRLGAVVLPVTLLYLRAESAGAKNIISWATSQELNSDRFDILHSIDGVNFVKIGTLTSKGGAVNTYYTFEDRPASEGNNYYRLSQVDKDGKVLLSKIVMVSNSANRLYVQNYPNPVHDNLTISAAGVANGTLQVQIADMQGKTVFQQQWKKDKLLVKKTIDVAVLENGIYQVIIMVGQDKKVTRFIKY